MGTAAHDLEQQRDRRADRSATQCRICAVDIDDDGMHIFAEDGRRHYLQTKIRKYLHILVSHERVSRAARIFFGSPLFSLFSFFFFKIASPMRRAYVSMSVCMCVSLSQSRAGRDKFQPNLDFRNSPRADCGSDFGRYRGGDRSVNAQQC